MLGHSCAGIKPFASESLTAIYVFGLFLQHAVKPSGRFPELVKCFQYLVDLPLLIMDAREPLKALDTCKKHHEAFMSLYPQCWKPKLHYIYEAILAWIRHGVLYTTFSAEAEHMFPKRLLHFLYNDAFVTAMVYWANHFMECLDDPDSFAIFGCLDKKSRRPCDIRNVSMGSWGICDVPF